jgi:hypothetical protein
MDCDICNERIVGEVFEARIPRPSDPADMCCIMVACKEHADQIGAKSASYWEKWIEGEGAKQGFLWLS